MSARGGIFSSTNARKSEGRVVLMFLVVLLAVAAVGVWNYQRNLAAEATDEKPRPFESYATADLEALRSAYSQEISAYQKQFAAQNSKRRRPHETGLIDERVEEFARVQKTSSRLREIGADVAEREARLHEIDLELGARAARLSGTALHLKRLFTI